MAEMQRIVVESELDLRVRYRRICQSCEGQLPIKDYQKRNILMVFGAVPVRYPQPIVCQNCHPWTSFTLSPATEISPDRATPELQEISASLGARMSYREASYILAGSFEAVVGHCGRGATPGPVFAFEGTRPAELKAVAALALAEQGYAGQGDITSFQTVRNA